MLVLRFTALCFTQSCCFKDTLHIGSIVSIHPMAKALKLQHRLLRFFLTNKIISICCNAACKIIKTNRTSIDNLITVLKTRWTRSKSACKSLFRPSWRRNYDYHNCHSQQTPLHFFTLLTNRTHSSSFWLVSQAWLNRSGSRKTGDMVPAPCSARVRFFMVGCHGKP